MRASIISAATAAIALAGCSEEAPEPQNQAGQSQELAPGMYEARWNVTALRSTDKTDPATDMAVGAAGTSKGCVGPGLAIDTNLFAAGADQCTATNSYTRGGRINIQMQCKRPEESGPVMQTVTGTYAGESFEGEITTSTYFSGFGDYSMTRTLSAQRVGECPAEDPAALPS